MPKVVATMHKGRENWDMSQERAFMENLLNKRFHFFLILYSIVVGGYLNTKDQLQLLIILILGILIAFPLALTIARAGYRLTLIISILYRIKNHPLTIIRDRARGFSVRWIISYGIPSLCCLSLLVATAYWIVKNLA